MQRDKVLKLIMNQASLLKTMNRPSLEAATTLKQSCCDFKYFQQITSSLSKPLQSKYLYLSRKIQIKLLASLTLLCKMPPSPVTLEFGTMLALFVT